MVPEEKKIWQHVASIGCAASALFLLLSIWQYIHTKQFSHNPVERYAGLITNMTALTGFIMLVFNPMNFTIYAIIAYVYGVGNILDGGNALAASCLLLCGVFLYTGHFFDKSKTKKIILLAIPVVIALVSQIFTLSVREFLITLMHFVGIALITALIALVLYPRNTFGTSRRRVYFINPEDCTQTEKEWLDLVLEGETYSNIALRYNLSESRVKIRMLELYHMLNVPNRTEFFAAYQGCTFAFSVNTPSIKTQKDKEDQN